MPAMTGAESPLSGLTVVELCTGIGGLSAGALLAGLGADVVQVGTPPSEDDPLRVWADRLKHRLEILPADADETGALRRLADTADVLLSDLPPGRLERHGLDPVTFGSRNPEGVHAWLPAFGSVGRWSHLHYDPLLLAAVSGYADHYPSDLDRPIAPVVPTFGYLHGAMGAAAVAAGLVGHQRDGRGRAVTVTGLHATGAALATLMIQGIDVERFVSFGRSARGGPYFRLYQAGDGVWFHLAALSPGIFFRALDAIGRMDVMARDDVGGEFANLALPGVIDAVNTELERTFATAPAEQWLELLQKADVPAARVRSRDEWMASDMASAVTGWTHFRHPDVGDVRLPAFPISFSSTAAVATPPKRREPQDTNSGLPLAGLRVIDTSSYLAAPFSATLLSASGADVVKVEPPEGDPYRIHSLSYAVANQHKRAVALNLRDAPQRAVLLRLISASDVLVDNFREGGLEHLGLDEATLAQGNPGLVRCSLSAFGTDNPWSALPGFDPVLQSVTGLAVAQGGHVRPSPSIAPVVDVATGSLAALGVLSALYAQGVDGRGRHVRTSLAAGAVYVQSAEMSTYASRPKPPAGGPEFAGPAPERRYYRTNDGWLAVAATTAAQREQFHAVVGTDADIEATIAGESTIAWVDRLTCAGVPAAQVLQRKGALNDPCLAANAVAATFGILEFGRFRVVGAFVSWAGAQSPPRRSTGIGADTREVLQDFGINLPAFQ